ncbi:ion channel [uncultured Litoreibacter sp.]|uniref:ion channel n=1 Tax=uncultured Litoreibacter sp. TaxID=1392394 RepID=UPI00261E1835|nr:ion channel [uncultured Litoreibacter sp.]
MSCIFSYIRIFIAEKICGFRPSSENGSNSRRFLSRITFLIASIILLLGVFGFWNEDETLQYLGRRTLILWSIAFFTIVVIIPVLVIDHRNFTLNKHRLILDILISAFYSITVFGFLYHGLGIEKTANTMDVRTVLDNLYFSAITFSTLGFGDFRPSSSARGYAAIQGLWGNIHLGLLAGAVFYALVQEQEHSK